MAVETPLSRVIRRHLFENKVSRFSVMQQLIPYHVEKLLREDQTTRRDFRYIQVWYTRVLNLSLQQVRAYMDLVDLRELQGFSVELITREEDKNNDENGDAKEDEEEKDGVENNVVISSNTQETRYHLPGTYDQDGFYIGEYDGEDASEEPEEEPTRPEMQRSISWADEVEDALETGQLQTLSSGLDDSSSESSLETSSSLRRLFQSDPRGPLSKELRNLLEDIGADANVKRSRRMAAFLETEEFYQAESDWVDRVNDMENIAFEQRGRRPYEESPQEKDLLDTFDENLGVFQWQKEGLFLCWLTELVHKESFEQARSVWWVEVKLAAKHIKRKKPLPGSPLSNEVIIDDDDDCLVM
ncbi:hypothetical protein F4680DRAFT_471892 [Xylaria scruposa]|nr:hypothetical protein F4680DRAFT_471892 [Xylaria scruposa]